VVAYILVQKFALGVPHYRLEQHLEDEGVELERGMMSRYIISTDATSALIEPEKSPDGLRRSCKKGTSSPPSSTATTCCSRTPRGTAAIS
jgi:hypothetical protein